MYLMFVSLLNYCAVAAGREATARDAPLVFFFL